MLWRGPEAPSATTASTPSYMPIPHSWEGTGGRFSVVGDRCHKGFALGQGIFLHGIGRPFQHPEMHAGEVFANDPQSKQLRAGENGNGRRQKRKTRNASSLQPITS